jgi:hypothetical protein
MVLILVASVFLLWLFCNALRTAIVRKFTLCTGIELIGLLFAA